MLKFLSRYRTDVIVFGVGLLLFVAGLTSVFLRDRSAGRRVEAAAPSVSAEPEARIGPAQGEPLAPYIEKKRALLRDRAARQPAQATPAVVSFADYRKPADVAAFLASGQIRMFAVLVRIPLPGNEPVTLRPGRRGVAEAVEAWKREAGSQLREEIGELEQIIPTVDDREFRAVYQEDARAKRQALRVLESDPSLVFAVGVQGTYRQLATLGGREGVRLVDVPDDPAVEIERYSLRGLLPEDA